MPQVLDIQQFLDGAMHKQPVIDVRSPKEFEQGHIPGAVNIPLFDNEERAVVGTIYKQTGRQPAILKGMEIAGPKMAGIVSKAAELSSNTLYVHCWRGGMRSGFIAILLEMYGLKVCTLKGGYKKFRNFVLNSFQEPLPILLLGGKTGSGKTYILKRLEETGQQVIDLEGMAHHKGSAFGALGEKPQPSQEQFENELAYRILQLNKNIPVWMEDESRLIGKKVIPAGIWEQIRSARVIFLDLPFEERLSHIVKEYGKFPVEELEASIQKIRKRMGNEQAVIALQALEAGDLNKAFGYCLFYYDKAYRHGLSLRDKITVRELTFDTLDIDMISAELIKQLTITR